MTSQLNCLTSRCFFWNEFIKVRRVGPSERTATQSLSLSNPLRFIKNTQIHESLLCERERRRSVDDFCHCDYTQTACVDRDKSTDWRLFYRDSFSSEENVCVCVYIQAVSPVNGEMNRGGRRIKQHHTKEPVKSSWHSQTARVFLSGDVMRGLNSWRGVCTVDGQSRAQVWMNIACSVLKDERLMSF